jgi:hypothetical protein
MWVMHMCNPYGRLHGQCKKHAAFAWPCLQPDMQNGLLGPTLNSLTPSPRKVFSCFVPRAHSLPKSTPLQARLKSVTFEGDRQTYCCGEEVRDSTATPIARTFLLPAVLWATMGRCRCSGLRGTRTYSHCLKFYPWHNCNWILLFSKP